MRKYSDTIIDLQGNVVSGASVTVYLAGTTTKADLYSANDVTKPLANPLSTDSSGSVEFYAGNNRYDLVISGTGLSTTTKRDILLFDPAGFTAGPFVQAGAGAVARDITEKLKDAVSLKDFGAVGNGVADDTVAVQVAINSGAAIISGSGNSYAISSALTFNHAKQIFKDITFVFTGGNTQRLANITADDVTFSNIIFDGNLKQPRSALVFVDANVKRPKFTQCTFTRIVGKYWGSSVLNGTYGLLISPYGVVDFDIRSCLFKDLIKYNDGINTSPVTPAFIGGGFIGGVCFLPEDLSVPVTPQTVVSSGTISDCLFENITTVLAAGLTDNQVSDYDDADAIRTYADATGALSLDVRVSNCDFASVSKRAFKLRASGAVVDNCRIYAANGAYGMVCPIDTGTNNSFRNIRIYASALKPVINTVQVINTGEPVNQGIVIDGLYVSHCKSGFTYFALSTADTLQNITLRNAIFANVYYAAIFQASPLPASQKNIRFENVVIRGGGVNARAVGCSNAADVSSGVIIRNMDVTNADVELSGVNFDIDGLRIVINSSTYAGFNPAARILSVGSSGYGGFNRVKNVSIDASGASNTFSNANRPVLVYLIGDDLIVNNFNFKVANTQDATYRHVDIFGSTGVTVDGFVYDGPSYVGVGDTVGSPYTTVRNAVRKGTGATGQPFLYTNNAGTTDTLFENIVDYRPTTYNTITLNNGARFIVNNVSSRSSNVTIVQHGGLAKTANVNKF